MQFINYNNTYNLTYGAASLVTIIVLYDKRQLFKFSKMVVVSFVNNALFDPED